MIALDPEKIGLTEVEFGKAIRPFLLRHHKLQNPQLLNAAT